MTDPCFTCPLPDCDDTNPRCPLVIEAAAKASAKRKVRRNDRGWRIGEGHQRASTSDAAVRQARKLHEKDGWSYLDISAALGVNRHTVADWCQYKTRADA